MSPFLLAGILGLVLLSPAAAGESGSRDTTGAVTAVDQGQISGPPENPFNMPSDVAVGPDGDVYVLDGVNHRVVVYDAEGRLQFQFGRPGREVGQFAYPLGIAAGSEGEIYVADSGNHRVQVFTALGRPVEAVPLPAAASGTQAEPTDVALDPVRRRLYIADNQNHYILVYNLAGRRFEPAWGSPGQGQRQFRFPYLLGLSEQGYLFVVESINTRVQVLNPDGKFVGFVGGWGVEPGQLFRPKGVALWQDRVLVTDSYLGHIQVFDRSGRFFGALTDAAGKPMAFAAPTGIAVDASRSRLYVVELREHRVRRLDLETGSRWLDSANEGKAGAIGSTGPVGPVPKSKVPGSSASGKDSLPNSSRECAICHIRWVQAFDRTQPDGAMHDILERQAGSGEMCLSCHDGSVVDSRFKVWSTRHHTTDAVPSPAVHIPTKTFPLDGQGRMTCATCHTAHAVPGDSDLRTVIFLRQPNVDSSLCLSCHPEHAQKSERHHPLGRRDSPIPQVILDAGGKTSADGHTVLCQTCHEPHGARNAWMLVLPPSELCIACHTDKAPEAAPPAGMPVHRIGHTYAGFEPPKGLLDEKATFGPNGELSCLSCHRLHDASGVWPLLIRNNEASALCLGCHEKEQAVLGSPHDLRVSSPQAMNARGQNATASGPCGACHRIHGWARQLPQTNPPHSAGCMECHQTGGPGSGHRPYVQAHPVGVPAPPDVDVPLPLDPASRAIGCLTCHDPHLPRPPETPAPKSQDGSRAMDLAGPRTEDWGRKTEEGATTGPLSSDFQFLRRPGSELCVLCHDRPAESLQGPHDPARFAPALRETLGILPSMGSCRVCHTTHDAQGPHLWARLPADTPGGPASDLCGTCHDQDTVAKPQNTHHPLSNFGFRISDFGLKTADSPNPQSAIRNPQSEVSCLSCHDPHKGPSPHDPRRDLCATCHEEQLGIRGSVHDLGAGEWAQKLGFVAGNLCRDCHPIHAPKTESPLWKSLEKAPVSPDLCEACHRPGGPGPAAPTVHVGQEADFGLRMSDFGWKKADDTNPQSTIRNPQSAVRCSTCHNIHQKGQRPDLLRASRRDSVLCRACHTDQSRLMDGPHDLRKSAVEVRNTRGEPVAESGPCGVCHFVHPKSTDRGTWAQPPLSGDDYGKGLCTCCHQPEGCAAGRLPENADHPEVALLNRLAPEDPAYMPLFDARGQPSPTGVISCPTCHQVHSIPAQPPAEGGPSHPMFLRTGNQTLCADCHGIEAPWRFLYYHRANRSPQRRSAPTAATIKGKREPPAFNQGKP